MVRLLATPMIASSATSLLLAGMFWAISRRIRRIPGSPPRFYVLYALLAASNAVFLGFFAVFVNSAANNVLINITNRAVIISAMYTIALAIHFFSSFFEYPPPVGLRWIYGCNIVFTVLCSIPTPLFLGWGTIATSRYYKGLVFGPLFQLWGVYVLAISSYGLLILVLILRRAHRRRFHQLPSGFHFLLVACTLWLLTGIADDLTGIQVVDLPPMTWFGSFLITIAIAWVLVQHVESLYDEKRHLYHQLIHDHLTGAYSRSYFELKVSDTVRRLDKEPDAAGGDAFLVLFDIDDFKRVNDSFGHLTGDELLRAVAQAVVATVRQTDIVARFGGDEFAILLDHVFGSDNAIEIVQRLRSAVAATTLHLTDATVRVTCSIGITSIGRGSSTDELMMAADAAMYTAKSRGKNTWLMAGSSSDSKPNGDDTPTDRDDDPSRESRAS
jgi:diguanylate cyclase (GGDEF)-like protein